MTHARQVVAAYAYTPPHPPPSGVYGTTKRAERIITEEKFETFEKHG